MPGELARGSRAPACPGTGTRETATATSPDRPDYIHPPPGDAEGNRIGKISQMFPDEQTGQPQWVLVETGLFGTRQSFAPIRGSKLDGELVVLAVSKDKVKDAPHVESGEQLSDSDRKALRQYYSG